MFQSAGSIGVVTGKFNVGPLLEEVGIATDSIKVRLALGACCGGVYVCVWR